MYKIFSCVCFIVLFFIISPSSVKANDEQTIKDSINVVKSDSAFIWAENTNQTREKAYQHACRELVWNINQYRISSQLDTLSTAAVLSQVHQLYHMRGSLYRVFVYAPFALSLPIDGISDIQAADDQDVLPESDSGYKGDSLLVEGSLGESARPVTVEPNDWTDVLLLLNTITMIDDAILVLKQLQAEHKITSFGQVRKMSDTMGNIYLLIFNRTDYTVLALVEGREGSFRGVRSNRVVDLKQDYPGCGAIWFK